MPENQAITAENITVETPKISSIGKIQRVEMSFPQENYNTETQVVNTNNEGDDATPKAKTGAGASQTTTVPTPTELTEEQIKSFFESKGIKYDGLEKLKEKINFEPNLEPTEEQKIAKAKEREQRVLNKFINGGGTGEQYYALKNVAEADVTELSKNTLKKELKDAGFDEKEVDAIIKERYYQYADEDLEQFEEETDKAFAKRKKEYGDKLLSNRSLPIKTQAAGILKGIQEAIDSDDLQAQQEVAFSAKIDEDFKVLPRKLSIEIGKIGTTDVLPVEYDVSENDVAEVKAMLKDPAQRNNLLYNQDGSLNITRLATALVKEKAFNAASKISFLEGQTRNNAHWQKTFGAGSPQELGIGGTTAKPNGQQTQPVKVGKVQRVQPQRQ